MESPPEASLHLYNPIGTMEKTNPSPTRAIPQEVTRP